MCSRWAVRRVLACVSRVAHELVRKMIAVRCSIMTCRRVPVPILRSTERRGAKKWAARKSMSVTAGAVVGVVDEVAAAVVSFAKAVRRRSTRPILNRQARKPILTWNAMRRWNWSRKLAPNADCRPASLKAAYGAIAKKRKRDILPVASDSQGNAARNAAGEDVEAVAGAVVAIAIDPQVSGQRIIGAKSSRGWDRRGVKRLSGCTSRKTISMRS
jgi:hypothetical protein